MGLRFLLLFVVLVTLAGAVSAYPLTNVNITINSVLAHDQPYPPSIVYPLYVGESAHIDVNFTSLVNMSNVRSYIRLSGTSLQTHSEEFSIVNGSSYSLPHSFYIPSNFSYGFRVLQVTIEFNDSIAMAKFYPVNLIRRDSRKVFSTFSSCGYTEEC